MIDTLEYFVDAPILALEDPRSYRQGMGDVTLTCELRGTNRAIISFLPVGNEADLIDSS
jgi:hypothetical protein